VEDKKDCLHTIT